MATKENLLPNPKALAEALGGSRTDWHEDARAFCARYRVTRKDVELSAIQETLACVAPHDKATITFEFADGLTPSCTLSALSGKGVVDDLRDEIVQAIECELEVTAELVVRKAVSPEGHYVVYDMQRFSEWIVGSCPMANLVSLMDAAMRKSGGQQLKISFPNDEGAAIAFEGTTDQSSRERVTERRRALTSVDGFASLCVVPQDFKIEKQEGIGVDVVNLFSAACNMLSLAFISCRSSFSGSTVEYSIDGRIQHPPAVDAKACMSSSFAMFDLFLWVYSSGDPFDKAEIARSMLCTRADDACIVYVDPDLIAAIERSYSVHVRADAQAYLVRREKLAEAVASYSDHVADCTIGFIGDFKRNLAAILGYLASVLFIRQMSADPSSFFSGEIAQVSTAVLAASLIYGAVSLLFHWRKSAYYKRSAKAMAEGFTDLFSDEELEKLVWTNPQLLGSQAFFRRWAVVLMSVWALICIGIFLLIDYLSGDTMLFGIVNAFPSE